MKATTKRLLSAVLAILMVLAVCPVIALAETTAAQAEEITYWDGTVPGVDTATTTIPEFIMSGATYTITAEEYAAHINEWNGGLSVKDEIGFAMLVLLTNCPYEITGRTAGTGCIPSTCIGDDETPTIAKTMAAFNYKKININKDLYLNAPDAHVNQVAPLFWKLILSSKQYAFYVNGNNHSINGWYMDATLSKDDYVSNGFIGALPNAAFTAENLALIDMELNITTTSTFTKTVVIGGIVGGGKYVSDYAVNIKNCFVDLTTKFVSHDPKVVGKEPGDLWKDDCTIKVDIGGLVGELSYIPGAVGNGQSSNIKKANLTNSTIMLDYDTNSTYSRVSGITGSTLTAASAITFDNIVVADMTNSGSVTPKHVFGSIESITAGTFTATDIWTVGTMNANLTDPSNKVITQVNLVSDAFWAANGTGMDGMTKLYYPVPTTLATNEAVKDLMIKLNAPLFPGAQLRLNKNGIRFIGEFDVTRHSANANGRTIEYGFLVLPTVAMTKYGESLTYDNPLTLKIATTDLSYLLAEGDENLKGIKPIVDGNRLLFAVMTEIPDDIWKTQKSFTAVPFVAYLNGSTLDEIIYGDSKEYNGVDVANKVVAPETTQESDDKRIDVVNEFSGAIGFHFTMNGNQFVRNFAFSEGMSINVLTNGIDEKSFVTQNAILQMQKEIKARYGVDLPFKQVTTFEGLASGINISFDAEGENTVTYVAGDNGVCSMNITVTGPALIESAMNYLFEETNNENKSIPSTFGQETFTEGFKASAPMSSTFLSTYQNLTGQSINNDSYKLVWGDEFNGSALDLEKWTFAGENPVKLGVERDNSAYVEGGNLHINATKAAGSSTFKTSNLVTTFDTMNFYGGYLEMRAKVPFQDIGEWVSLWATNGHSVLFKRDWYENGNTEDPAKDTSEGAFGLEVDILELFSDTSKYNSNVLLWKDSIGYSQFNNGAYFEGNQTATVSSLATDYHTYSFYWNDDYMAFAVDDVVYAVVTMKSTIVGSPDYLGRERNALSLLLQNDVFTPDYCEKNESTWVGVSTNVADATDSYSSSFVIDYIRLYQCENDVLYLPDEVGKGEESFDYAKDGATYWQNN